MFVWIHPINSPVALDRRFPWPFERASLRSFDNVLGMSPKIWRPNSAAGSQGLLSEVWHIRINY